MNLEELIKSTRIKMGLSREDVCSGADIGMVTLLRLEGAVKGWSVMRMKVGTIYKVLKFLDLDDGAIEFDGEGGLKLYV
jgi:transcriptional regulator with XRE-family HTH domain